MSSIFHCTENWQLKFWISYTFFWWVKGISLQIKPEHIIEYEITLCTALLKVEYLGEHHGWPIVNWQFARDETQNAFIDRRLGIKCVDLMRDLAKSIELAIYCFLAHELLAFEAQHRLRHEHLHQILDYRYERVNQLNKITGGNNLLLYFRWTVNRMPLRIACQCFGNRPFLDFFVIKY